MKEPLRSLRPVTTAPEQAVDVAAAPDGCRECRSLERKLTKANNRIEELQAQVDRLLRALQREAHHIDKRSDHSGRKEVIGRLK